MTSTSAINPGLLEALHVTEVRDAEAFSDLTHQRAQATDGRCLTYRFRHPAGAQSPGGPLTTLGNTPLGGLLFSAVSDQVDTTVEFVGEHSLAVCITVVLRGSFRATAPGSGKVDETSHVQVTRIEPGMQVTTGDRCERINLFTSLARLERDIELASGAPLREPLRFAPEGDWPPGTAASLRRLTTYIAEELVDPYSLLSGGVGIDVFEDLLVRTLVNGVPHNHTAAMGRHDQPVSKAALRRARELIRSSTSRLSVSAIAAQVGCSPRHLTTAFRSEYGQGLVAAQRDARLDAAHLLMKRSDLGLRVSEVAAQHGFSNVSRFSRQYRRRFGQLP